MLASHGCYITEACDKCGTLLGAVRYKRQGEPGEWCSALCRDGIEAVAQREARKAGRRANMAQTLSVNAHIE